MDLENFTKSLSGHQHLRQNLWFKYHDLNWSGSWDVFHKLSLDYIRKTGKGDNSVMDLENFVKKLYGHLHSRHNLWSKYDDFSSSGS